MNEVQRNEESGAGEAGAKLADLLYGGWTYVPAGVAICPECGGKLAVESSEWEDGTGKPSQGGLVVDCDADPRMEHRYFQSDWQLIMDKIEKWCGAVAV